MIYGPTPGDLDDDQVRDAYPWPDHGRWVRAMMVTTLDGAAAGPDGLSGSISSDVDRAVFDAVRRLVAAGTPPEAIDEATVGTALYTAGLPDPDLVIRTGGEQRLSNFLIWQSAYAELYFCEALWPDFGPAAFDEALLEFARRQRRFGR